MSVRRIFRCVTLSGGLLIVAGCSSDKHEAKSASEEGRYEPVAASETPMTPASRPMGEAEQASRPEWEATEPTGAAPTMDCPVDVADTGVAVMSEAKGISMVFKLDDPSNTGALDALRLRVRGLAERYRNERLAAGGKATSEAPYAQHSAEEGAADMQASPGYPQEPGAPTTGPVSPGEGGASETGKIVVTVQDTRDGAKIIIASEDAATLDVLRARLSQDAQIMTETGACPW